MNLDDIEKILEGILAGLKARKEIEPLRQKISELETANANLTSERDKLSEKNSDLQTRLEELTTELKNSRRQLDDAREDFKRQLDEQKTEFEQKISDANAELEDEQKNSLQQLAAARENFKRQLGEQKTEFEQKISDANEKRKAAEHTADFYRTTYAELENAYKIYLSLDEATRFDLAGIFGAGDNVTGFFSGAVQENHLPQFWDYVSRHVDDTRLAELFDFCFAAFNRGFREPPYSRLTIERGTYFDDETMRRTSNSRQMGRVARVLLQGYRYSSGNVIRQSVVELA